MDKGLLEEIAKQIVKQEILGNWGIICLFVALTFVTTAAASFFASYFRSRGANLATKADLDFLIEQQAKLRETTAKIEQTISHKDWTIKENKTLRRTKLEELLLAAHEMEAYLEKDKNEILFDGPPNDLKDPEHQVQILGALYFPELDKVISAWLAASRTRQELFREISVELEKGDKAKVLEENTKRIGENFAAFWKTVKALDSEGRKLMADIVKVE